MATVKGRVCVICPAFGALVEDEIAAMARHLASLLAESSETVTLLLAGDHVTIPNDLPAGVTVVPLPPSPVPFATCAPATEISYRCRDWLAEQEFDLVLCPERGGLAYYPLLARRQRLALATTAIVVLAWGPSLWVCEADGRLVDDFNLLAMDHQERRAVAMADAVVVPHEGLLDWMRQNHWSLPADIVRLPLPAEFVPPTVPPVEPAPKPVPVTELVYVGALDLLNGLAVFCSAIERLGDLLAARGIAVRLLGPARPQIDFDALAYLEQRSAHWPFSHIIEAVPLTDERLGERLGAGRLAVLPIQALGEPVALQACLALGTPLLISDLPGVAELLQADHRAELVPSTTPGLAERLAIALDQPPLPPAPATANAALKAAWIALAQRQRSAAVLPAAAALPPVLVSLCLTHFNRPQMLERAVASVLAQSWRPLQVIVIDDGSHPAALARLDELERMWGDEVTVIRQPNRYLGAARNRAAAEARGEFLLFMDDDNIAEPDEIATMLRVVEETGADVVTTVTNVFTDDEAFARGEAAAALWVPLGAAAAGGLYSNVFGDANALIRRSAFQAVGGFSEEYGLGLEDWELFAKLIQAGFRLEVVAKPLLWYRQNPGSMLLASINRPAELRRAATAYFAAVPPALAPALLLAQGFHHRYGYYIREYAAASQLAKERLEAMRSVERLVVERDRTMIEMQSLIVERDQTIADQAAMLDERWAAMTEMQRLVVERNQTIADQAAMLDERWMAMTEMQRLIVERDQTIADQAAMLDERWAAMTEMQQTLAEQARQLRTLPVRVLRKLGMLGSKSH